MIIYADICGSKGGGMEIKNNTTLIQIFVTCILIYIMVKTSLTDIISLLIFPGIITIVSGMIYSLKGGISYSFLGYTSIFSAIGVAIIMTMLESTIEFTISVAVFNFTLWYLMACNIIGQSIGIVTKYFKKKYEDSLNIGEPKDVKDIDENAERPMDMYIFSTIIYALLALVITTYLNLRGNEDLAAGIFNFFGIVVSLFVLPYLLSIKYGLLNRASITFSVYFAIISYVFVRYLNQNKLNELDSVFYLFVILVLLTIGQMIGRMAKYVKQDIRIKIK